MSGKDQETPAEIVIVRRRRGGEECHHGGVWKVAYADFMTAMMAFFLVMWLINAANEETRSQVASYFNPVKLVDTTTNPRGLQDNKNSSSGDVENKKLKPEAYARADDNQANADDNKQKHMQRKKGPAAHFSGGDVPESELFRDPVRTLDRIAGGAPDLLKGSARPRRRQETLGAAGGRAFRDPFSPRSWKSLEETLPEEPRATAGGGKGQQRVAAVSAAGKAAHGGAAKAAGQRQESGKEKAGKQAAGMAGRQAKQAGSGADKAVRELRAALLKARAGGNAARLPAVNVRRVSEGILITLADHAGFGMFDVGSARPRPQTVRFMERVARILKDRPGDIVVRGHTDGRPFRNGVYDNWRLSTARAHMARYMLLRGGIAGRRILRVEGYADRKLAVPGDPLAAANRRIEILLREKGK